jgi:hypothetical protein
MANVEDNLVNRRLALHCAVMQANERGAPQGQRLQVPFGEDEDAPVPVQKGKATEKSLSGKRVSCFVITD